ncbi:MAG: DUF2752 domain-containing protein [Oscillospiraceae bacterium]
MRKWTSGGRESARLLLLHLAFCAAAGIGVLLLFASGLRFPPCAFHALTGFYCLTCGATRASYELARLHFVRSLILNPLPIMLAVWLVSAMSLEFAGVIKNRRYRFRGWQIWLYLIVAITFVYFVLRNFGFVPIPEAIFP